MDLIFSLMSGEGEIEADATRDKRRKKANLVMAVLRCLLEDFLQAAIQLTFVMTTGQGSPQVLASICLSFTASVAGMCYAIYEYNCT